MRNLLVIGALALCLTGCASAPPNLDNLIWAASQAYADGVVTPEETAQVAALLPQPRFDWAKVGEVLGGVAVSILGVKLIPTRHLRSPFDPAQPQQA